MAYQYRETKGQAGQPLALTFHGTGGDESQFHGFAEQLLPGAHVLSPRGDVSEAGMNRFFRRTGEGVYDMEDLTNRTAAIADFIAEARTRTGASRVVGLGYSNGANILASVAFDRPELVDDLILMHPLIPWQPGPQPGLAGRRVLITAGHRDSICPAPMSEALIGWFEAQKARVTTAWHPGGHEIAQPEIDAIAQFLGQG